MHHLVDIAIKNNNSELLNVLLKGGLDVDAKNSNGLTALMLATCKNNIKAAELLISHGANVDVIDSHGNTARDYALSLGLSDFLKVIFRYAKEPRKDKNNNILISLLPIAESDDWSIEEDVFEPENDTNYINETSDISIIHANHVAEDSSQSWEVDESIFDAEVELVVNSIILDKNKEARKENFTAYSDNKITDKVRNSLYQFYTIEQLTKIVFSVNTKKIVLSNILQELSYRESDDAVTNLIAQIKKNHFLSNTKSVGKEERVIKDEKTIRRNYLYKIKSNLQLKQISETSTTVNDLTDILYELTHRVKTRIVTSLIIYINHKIKNINDAINNNVGIKSVGIKSNGALPKNILKKEQKVNKCQELIRGIRLYKSKSLFELEQIVTENTNSSKIIQNVLDELSHRKSKGSINLRNYIYEISLKNIKVL